MRRYGLPPALVVAFLALGGCGGNGAATDDPGETSTDAVALYEEEVRAADVAIRAAAERLGAGTADAAQLETELEEARRRLDQSFPPYQVLTEHQNLSQALGAAVDLSAGLAAAGEPYPPGEVEQLRQVLADAEQALADLEERGYDVRGRT